MTRCQKGKSLPTFIKTNQHQMSSNISNFRHHCLIKSITQYISFCMKPMDHQSKPNSYNTSGLTNNLLADDYASLKLIHNMKIQLDILIRLRCHIFWLATPESNSKISLIISTHYANCQKPNAHFSKPNIKRLWSNHMLMLD